jgi:hypothetical protein
MMKAIVAALVVGAGVGIAAQVSTASAESANYNGTWSVQLVTESGSVCDSSYSYAIAIRDGQVRLASASEGASVSGRIGQDGSVGINVQQGNATGTASGRLRTSSGSGTWRVASLCTGRWTATRRSTVTAQASY